MAAASTAVLVLIFATAGALLGLAARGRVRARRPRVAWLAVLILGLALRGSVEAVTMPHGLLWLTLSYGLLLAFCARNIAWPGMAVVVVGLLACLAPTVVNRGMPVGARALAASTASTVDAGSPLDTVELGGLRHLERSDDELLALAEILPLPLARRAVSFGELIALVALGDVMFHAVARRAARRRTSTGRRGEPPARTIEQRLAGLTIEDTGEFVRVLGPIELSPDIHVPARPAGPRPAADAELQPEASRQPGRPTANVARVAAGPRQERLRATRAG